MTQAAPKILLIAEDPDATMLSAALVRIGYEPTVVSSVADGGSSARKGDWAGLVVTEELLPSNVGEYFAEQRQESDIPTLVVGWGEGDSETQLLLHGVDCYMVRPIDDELLRARLRALARRRSLNWQRAQRTLS